MSQAKHERTLTLMPTIRDGLAVVIPLRQSVPRHSNELFYCPLCARIGRNVMSYQQEMIDHCRAHIEVFVKPISMWEETD